MLGLLRRFVGGFVKYVIVTSSILGLVRIIFAQTWEDVAIGNVFISLGILFAILWPYIEKGLLLAEYQLFSDEELFREVHKLYHLASNARDDKTREAYMARRSIAWEVFMSR